MRVFIALGGIGTPFVRARERTPWVDELRCAPTPSLNTGHDRPEYPQYIKDGAFPKPVRFGPRAVGWLEADVNGWITTRVKFARVDARLAA